MKRESKYASKTGKHGPQLPKSAEQLARMNPAWNAPVTSWWLNANGDFYERAKQELPRIYASRMHYQMTAVRIVGHLE